MIEAGELLHIVTRRRFEDDIRRHFVGEVENSNETTVRVRGYSFIYDTNRNKFVKCPEFRTRIFSLCDSDNVIHVLDEDVKLGALNYGVSTDGRLVLTDGKEFELEIAELSFMR